MKIVRLEVSNPAWRRQFAWLPTKKINGQWIWLRHYEYMNLGGWLVGNTLEIERVYRSRT